MTDKEKELQAEAIGYLRNRIAELEMTVGTLRNFSNEQATCIERLEKENKVLAQNLEDTEILNKTYEKRFSDLEKENAELKEDSSEWEKASDKWKSVYELTNQQLEMSNKVYNDNLDYSHHIEGQLTKAKELLKWFVWYFREDYNNVPYKHKVEEAEQFLSEVEK